MKKEKQREIPKKNYYYLAILTIVTCFVLGCFVKWYKLRLLEQPVRTISISAATEIKPGEINNYILENPDVIVYIANSKDESLTSFENTFENYLHNKELLNKMVYVDTATLTEDERKLIETLLFNGNTIVDPNFIIVASGKKIEQLYSTTSEIKLNDVHQFLNRYEVVE